jgi:hypothetical protein
MYLQVARWIPANGIAFVVLVGTALLAASAATDHDLDLGPLR